MSFHAKQQLWRQDCPRSSLKSHLLLAGPRVLFWLWMNGALGLSWQELAVRKPAGVRRGALPSSRGGISGAASSWA